MSQSFSTPLPTTGDNERSLMAKWLQALGGDPQGNDNEAAVLGKILENLAGGEVEPEPGAAVPLNSLLRVTSGADGDAITEALLNAWETGDAWTWTLNRDPAHHTRVETSDPASYADGNVTVEGSPVSGSTTRSIKFDHDEAVIDGDGYDDMLASPPEEITELVLSGFIDLHSENAVENQHTHDHIEMVASPYLTLQVQYGMGDSGGTAGRVHIETQIGASVTQRGNTNPINAGRYHYELWWKSTGEKGLILRTEDRSALVTTSYYLSDITGGTVTQRSYQDYLTITGGYTQFDEIGATWKEGDVTCPLFPLTVPTIDEIEGVQIAPGTIEWNLLHPVQAFTYKIELHDGSSWTTLYENRVPFDWGHLYSAHLRHTETGLTDGLSYKLRVTPKIGTATGTPTESNVVTINDATAPIAWDDFDSYGTSFVIGDAADWTAVLGSQSGFTAGVVATEGQDGFLIASSTSLHYHTSSPNANHRAEVVIKAAGAGGNFDWLGAAVRVQEGSADGYGVVFSSADLYLLRYDAGVLTILNSDTAETLSPGDQISIEASGTGSATRLTVQVNKGAGWVTKWSNVDPGTYYDGGHAGLCTAVFGGLANQITLWRVFNL